MEEKTDFKKALTVPAAFIAILWVIKFAEVIFDFELTFMGNYPLEFSSLIGIVTSPLIHGDFNHLISNTFSLLILMIFLFSFYKQSAIKILAVIWLVGGLMVWLLARSSFHIGASGLVYGLCSFFFFSGIIGRDRKSLTLALIVVFLYSGLVVGLFPVKERVSWEGHLFGAVSGLIAAFIFTDRTSKKRYDWEDEELPTGEKPEISYKKGYPFE